VITLEQIRELCPGARLYEAPPTDNEEEESKPAPGVGLRHYAPRAKLILLEGEQLQRDFSSLVSESLARGERVGLMFPDGFPSGDSAAVLYRWGQWSNQEELAHRLFAGLRELDAANVDVILCPLPASTGIGTAIRDRLLKAAK
jgi:L-threonylcarbamoyladenylate synthase